MPPIEEHTLVVSTKVKGDLAKSMKMIRDESEGAAKSTKKFDAASKRLSPKPLQSVASAANMANKSLLNMVKSATLMGYNLQGIALLAINKLRTSFIDLSDQYNRVIGQMEKYSGSSAKATALTHKLQEVAITTGWDLDSLSSTFTKLGTGLEMFGQTEQDLIEITQGLGLKFRQMGDDGKRLPKVAGQLVTLFTSATFQFSKFDSLLGRGRAEQLFGDIAKEMGKIPGVDLAGAAKRGESAMSVLQKAFKAGKISANQISEAFIRVAKAGNALSPAASEIGHGWDKLAQAVVTIITRFDKLTGFSNTIAAGFSWLAKKIKDNLDVIPKLMFYFEQIKKIGLGALLIGAGVKIVILTKKVLLLAKSGWAVIKAIKLADIAWKRTAFGVAIGLATAAAIKYSSELDNVAKKIPKAFGWARDLVLLFTKTLKGAKEGIVDLFDDKAYKKFLADLEKDVDKANKVGKGGSGAGSGGDDTGTTGGSTAPAPIAVTSLKQLRNQMNNINVAAKNNWITDKQRVEKLKQLNNSAKDVIASNAKWLVKNKATLTGLQSLVTQTDKYNKVILPAEQAFDNLTKVMNNVNAAARVNSISEKDRVKLLQQQLPAMKALLVTHGAELESQDKLRQKIKDTIKEIEKLKPAEGFDWGALLSGIGSATASAAQGLGKVAAPVVAGVREEFKDGGGVGGEAVQKAVEKFAETGDPLAAAMAALGPIIKGVADALIPILKAFKTSLGKLFKVINQLIPVLAKAIAPVLEALAPAVEALAVVVDAIRSITEKVVTPIMKNVIAPVLKFIAKLIREVINALAKFLNWLGADIRTSSKLPTMEKAETAAAKSAATAITKIEADRSRLGTARSEGWLTIKEYNKALAGLNERAKALRVTHAEELSQNNMLLNQLEKTITSTNKYTEALKESADASNNAQTEMERVNKELRIRAEEAELELALARQAQLGVATSVNRRFIRTADTAQPQQLSPRITIVNVDDPEAVNAQLASEDGEKVFLNMLRRNDEPISEYVTR